MENENSSKYEIMVILHPDLVEDQTQKEFEEIRNIITSNEGEVYHEDIRGIRDFAYKMGKEEQGFYAVFNFTLDPGKLKALDKPLRLNQQVLRYLIIKTPDNYKIRTLEEYEAEADKERKKPEKEEVEVKKEEKPKKEVLKEIKEEKPKEEKSVEKPKKEKAPEEPKKEKPKEKVEKEEKPVEKPEKKPEEKPKAKPSKVKLDDIDEKLRSIIDDPDITL